MDLTSFSLSMLLLRYSCYFFSIYTVHPEEESRPCLQLPLQRCENICWRIWSFCKTAVIAFDMPIYWLLKRWNNITWTWPWFLRRGNSCLQERQIRCPALRCSSHPKSWGDGSSKVLQIKGILQRDLQLAILLLLPDKRRHRVPTHIPRATSWDCPCHPKGN